eukprot:s1130_g7.t1
MSMRRADTHYQVLGTCNRASAAEIKAAFKRQALALHPDKGGSKEAFQRALRAFEVLSDESSRTEYDRSLQKAKSFWRTRPGLRKKPSPFGGVGGHPKSVKKAGKQSPAKAKMFRGGPQKGGQPQCDFHQADLSGDGRSSHRLSQIKTVEDELMAKVFSLLQKLPPSRRLKLLQDCFSQTHRLALEAWVLAYRNMHKGQRLLSVTEPETASFSPADPSESTSKQCRQDHVVLQDGMLEAVDRQKTLAITDSEQAKAAIATTKFTEKQPPKATNTMRGIASFYRKGIAIYQVSVCVQSLCITARKVKELDRAIDILLILMSIKQKIGRVEPELFAQSMTAIVPAVLAEHGMTAEDLGLRFQVMMCMRFWVRPPLHTPQQAKLEDALSAWCRLIRFRSPVGQGARGFARMDLNELQERWLAFREEYLDILETRGFGGHCGERRSSASRRLDALAEASRPQRERRLERWNRLAMLQEDRPRHQSKKAARAFEREQRGRKRKATQLAVCCRSHRKDAASTGGRRRSWCATSKSCKSAAEAHERTWKRLLRLLGRWDRAHQKGQRILAAGKKAAEKEAAFQKQKEAQAAQQAQRERRAAMSVERAAARRMREEQRSRWKWLNRKDITMEELLHSKGCHAEACCEGGIPPCQPGYTSPLLV